MVVCDVAGDENEQTARLIEASGGRALPLRCDVTRSEDVKAAFCSSDQTADQCNMSPFVQAFNATGGKAFNHEAEIEQTPGRGAGGPGSRPGPR